MTGIMNEKNNGGEYENKCDYCNKIHTSKNSRKDARQQRLDCQCEGRQTYLKECREHREKIAAADEQRRIEREENPLWHEKFEDAGFSEEQAELLCELFGKDYYERMATN